MIEPKPSISKVFNLISQEERQRYMKTSNPASAIIFQTSQTSPSPEPFIAAYVNGYKQKNNRPICSHCGLAGHTINKCYKLHGYPQGYKIPNHTGYSNPQFQQQSNHNNSSLKPQQSGHQRRRMWLI